MNGPEEQTMHELLCAYVLGEASSDERTRVEAALAESSELREEKERLEATIGLVQDTYREPEALSESALAEVMRAAGAKPPAPRLVWHRSPAFRAAAAVLFVVGGTLAVLNVSDRAQAPAAEQVASVDAPARAGKDAADDMDNAAMRVVAEMDALASNVERRRNDLEEAPADSPVSEPEKADEAGGRADAIGGLMKNEIAEQKGAAADPNTALTDGAAPAADRSSLDDDEAAAGRLGEPRLEQEGDARSPSEELFLGSSAVPYEEVLRAQTGRPYQRPSGPTAEELAALHARSKLEGSDDFFLGGGKKRQAGPSGPASTPVARAGTVANAARQRPDAKGKSVYSGEGVEYRDYPWDQEAEPSRAPAGKPDEKKEAAKLLRDIGYASGEVADRLEALGYAGEAPDLEGFDVPEYESLERLKALGYPESEARELLEKMGYAHDDGDTDTGKSSRGAQRFAGGYRPHRVGGIDFERWVEAECERRIVRCYRQPRERPRDMYFRFWGDNAYVLSELDRLSTFGVDVDTASYVLARRYLQDGHLPEKAQVRVEEFLNYFDPDLPAPLEGDFAIHLELAPSLFGGREDRWMLRVGVRGREIPASERQPLALTFVVDTSGSMKEGRRLELVKHAIRLLVAELDARDSIAIVAYSDEARLILPMTSAAQRGLIESGLHPLTPGGHTNAEAGLRMGYELALGALAAGTHNRVVFLSDGVANSGVTDQDRISAGVRRHREQGIYLNTIGVGMNNHNDVFLEQLADKGDGICDYIDTEAAARRAIVDRFSGAFQPLASDVKIQVAFDPVQVHRWRLVGYENRAIADEDFRNDAIDAGEIGAGHQVVALYEIERTSAPQDGPLATAHLRWKEPKVAGQDPSEIDVTEIERSIDAPGALASYASASPGYRRSVLVAQFAELLRRSTHARGDSWEALLDELARLSPELSDPDFDELTSLVKQAYRLGLPLAFRYDELDLTLDEFRRLQIHMVELERLERRVDDGLLRQLRERNEELEHVIRDLIRRDLREKRK